MARAKDKPVKTALDTLQDWLSGGSQALLEGAQAVQQLVVATGRGVEEQLATLLGALEESLREQVDRVVTALASSLRSELADLREEVEELREQLQDPSTTQVIDSMLEPLRALANGALERAAYAQTRLTELTQRIEQAGDPSARLADLEERLATRANGAVAEQLAQLEQRLRELRVEFGEKTADLSSMRERLAKIEARVLETSKEQIARAGEATSLRDRLTRLDARLTDLSREQVARAVEAAGLRERVFRLEQRAGVYVQPSPEAPADGERPGG